MKGTCHVRLQGPGARQWSAILTLQRNADCELARCRSVEWPVILESGLVTWQKWTLGVIRSQMIWTFLIEITTKGILSLNDKMNQLNPEWAISQLGVVPGKPTCLQRWPQQLLLHSRIQLWALHRLKKTQLQTLLLQRDFVQVFEMKAPRVWWKNVVSSAVSSTAANSSALWYLGCLSPCPVASS